MQYFSKWDEIDKFLYYDSWHLKGHRLSIPHRINNIEYLNSLFEKQSIKFLCCDSTVVELIKYEQLKEDDYSDNFKVRRSDASKVLSILRLSTFEIVENQKKFLTIFKENRIIKIKFTRDFYSSFFIKTVNNNLGVFSYSMIELMYQRAVAFVSFFVKKVYLYFKRRYLIVSKKFVNYLFYRRLHISAYKKPIVDLNYKTFMNLRIEPKQSVNWILRKGHLNLVTKNKKYTKVKKIIYHLKKNKIENLLNNMVESDNRFVFEEPISHNKKFWTSGNNYFLNNIIFSFRKNVVEYQNANSYITQKTKPNLYSSKYYSSLEKMSEDEVAYFLEQNPIEVTNNAVTSGKHRVFAMIGWILEGNEYIPFKAIVN